MSRRPFYQRHPRATKRLEVSFSSGVIKKKGILSNMSLSGLFVRTNSGFPPGTHLDLEILLPDNTRASLRGVVVRTIKSPLKTGENGMGISLITQDEIYARFVQTTLQQQGIQVDEPSVSEYRLITCSVCGVKNRVPHGKSLSGSKCGKCRANLIVDIN
jgi:hypothetical protein